MLKFCLRLLRPDSSGGERGSGRASRGSRHAVASRVAQEIRACAERSAGDGH